MTFRISGLSSGIDTESIITALIDAEKTSMVRLEETVAEEQVKYQAWSALDTKLTDVKLMTQQLSSYGVWNQKTATSTDEDAFTATAGLSAQAGTYSVEVSQLAQAHRIASDAQASATTDLSLSGEFTVGGETVTVEEGDTLQDIRNAINEAAANMDADEKVRAYIIDTTLVIERDKTGDTDIAISEAPGGVLNSLGILDADGSTPTHVLQTSEDLSATINGVSVTSDTNTGVTTAIDGVTMNFYDETTGSETMTIGGDTETIKSLIGDFVEKYNDAMALATAQSAVVLTENEEDITATGILQGEGLIANITTKMRSILSTRITNPSVADQDYNSLYTAGIWFDSQKNELTIDEEKLDDALTNHFDEIEDLFRNYADGDSAGGIMRQLDDYLGDTVLDPVEGRLTTTIDNLQDDIKSNQRKIAEENSDLADYEEQLWEHFASMEEMVGNINSQWSYVSQQLGI